MVRGIGNQNVTNNKIKLKPDLQKPDKAAGSFEDALYEATKIKFSGHAKKRVEARNIKLENNDIHKISNAINKAATKGAKNSVLLMDKGALVVSVKNKTVITAIHSKELKGSIFTNIDSVIIT